MYVNVIRNGEAVVRGRRGNEAEGFAALKEGMLAMGSTLAIRPTMASTSDAEVAQVWGQPGVYVDGVWMPVGGECTAAWEHRLGYWVVYEGDPHAEWFSA